VIQDSTPEENKRPANTTHDDLEREREEWLEAEDSRLMNKREARYQELEAKKSGKK
jgi:hypothetical protein